MKPGTSRREFLRSSSALLLSAAAGCEAFSSRADGLSPVIDCHAHIYGEDTVRYPTIPEPYRPPAGKGTVSHLLEEMKASGVTHVTAIQTSTYYRWDNRFTVDSARLHSNVMAAVCTLDPDDPASPAQLERYVLGGGVRGMRSIPAKSGKLDDPGVRNLWATAERLGIVINVLVNRDKRAEVETLAHAHPALRIVIDHCLNLKAGPELEPTLQDMIALAALPGAHAKLTFIPTGTAEEYPCRDLHDACRKVIDAYGPERCVWGSDFPCELWCPKVTYAQHLRIFQEELGLDGAAQREILGATAHRLWFEPLAVSR